MEEKRDSVITAVVVFGALAAAWLSIELAFKPWLDKGRSAFNKSDPDHDPDDATGKSPPDADADDDDASKETA